MQKSHSSFRTFSRKKKGFTLIELMIVVVVVSILGAIVVPALLGGLGGNGDPSSDNMFGTKQAMVQYVGEMYPELESVRASCADWDSDGNGYIRCTATGINPATQQRESVEAECGVFLSKGKCVPIKHGRRW